MSIKSTAFFGYSVDIEEEMKELAEKYRRALLYDEFDDMEESEAEEYKKNMQSLGMVPYWDYSHRDKNDHFLLIYDGMSGEYTKLSFVIKWVPEADIYDDDAVKLFDDISQYLNKINVPEEIKQKYTEIYKFLFNKELDTDKIHLETFIHYS